jgi:RNA polymerase I-specific transcription initiation factor RRN5
VYTGASKHINAPSPVVDTTKNEFKDEDVPMHDPAESSVLQIVPEATLLNAKVMLKLSRDFFMNRSPDFPSPWLHWSEYISELAVEPSIYRTAFNDFHRLAVSVTKRLVHTALMQATSRVRARGMRKKKEAQPYVKKRDIRAAIDVLGLSQDRGQRWKGVPRRCGLKVTTSTMTTKGKRNTVVPWNEVERVLTSDARSNPQTASELESSTEPEEFKRRAARSGTPLPMQDLRLSDSEDDSEHDSLGDDDEDEPVEHLSVPVEGTEGQPRTLEDFDREASRQEEHALWAMLGLEPSMTDDTLKADDDAQDSSTKRLNATTKDWRDTAIYRAPWEVYNKPLSAAKFTANRKSLSPMPATTDMLSPSSRSASDYRSDASSTSGARKPRRRSPKEIELRAHGTTAYAALQGEDFEETEQEESSSSSDAADEEEDDEDDVMEQDIPTQSIEAEHDSSDYESSNK